MAVPTIGRDGNEQGVGRVAVPGLMLALGVLVAGCAASAASPTADPTIPRTVSVLATWTGAERDAFRQVVALFEATTGITVDYAATGDLVGEIERRVAAGDPPDLAGLTGPAHMERLARNGVLRDLGSVPELDGYLRETAPAFVALGMVDDRLSGAYVKATLKGLIWYGPGAEHLGRPDGWNDLTRTAERFSTDSTRPWCVGLDSPGSAGWPGTDWIENILLRQAGTRVWDAWVARTLPWTSPENHEAFATYLDVVAPDAVAGGPAGAIATDVRAAADGLFEDPPGCFYTQGASFQPAFFQAEGRSPGTDYDFFPMPDFDGGHSGSVEVAGDLFGLLSDRPEAASLLAYLTGADAQRIWAASGGALSANMTMTDYPDAVTRREAAVLTSASQVRFDASDQMPVETERAFRRADPRCDRRSGEPGRDAGAPRGTRCAVRTGALEVSLLVRRRFAPIGLSAAATLARFRAAGLAPEPRPHPVARTIATGVWLIAVLIELAAVAIWLSRGELHLPPSFAGGPLALASLTICSLLNLTMGAFLARRLPGNPVGWLLMGQGLVLMPVLPSALMVQDALDVLRPTPPLTSMLAWLVSSISAPVAIGSLTMVLILFPDGRPSSRRWAAALAVPLAGMALLTLGSAFDRTLIWYPMLPSPVASAAFSGGTAALARFAGVLCLAASVFIAAGSLIDRYRDADPELRRQLRWVVLDGAFVAVTVMPLLVGRYLVRPGDALGELLVAAAALGSATFPIAVGIAITRADLFDIDVIIGRTLVYLPLTAILAGMYAALLVFLQRVMVALTGGTSDAVVVLSTLVLAAAFTPVKQTLDGFVERHFRAPHGIRGSQACASVEQAAADAAADRNIDALLALVATHVERLEAVEARLLHLEHGPRLGRGRPVTRGSRQPDRRAAADHIARARNARP